MKYFQWLQLWLINYVKPTTKQRTYERYASIAALHIMPKLGEYELAELKPIVLQEYVTSLLQSGNHKTKQGLSANSVNGVITVIQNSLKTAFNLGEVEEYIANRIKRPNASEKQVGCFTAVEQKKIECYILSSKKPKLFGILLCLYTGLRIGELLALEWTDVDLEKGVIKVNKTCYDGKNEKGKFSRLIDTPKTVSSIRLIPIPKQLLPLLREQKKNSRSTYIVSSGESIISVRSYQRTFEYLLKRLKIPHKGFHSLRHTFATRALECGMDVKTLSEILGHKNPVITLNRYAHSLMEHKAEMMNRLGKLL